VTGARLNIETLMDAPPGLVPGTEQWSRWLAAMVCSVVARGRVRSVEWRREESNGELRLVIHMDEE
jgi:hypothetical protein